MSKRIYSSRIKKWAIGIGIIGVPLAALLIWYLVTLGVVEVTGISGDTICAGTEADPCLAYINFTVKEDIFIYPSEDWGSTPFYTDVQPKSVEMYRSWGSSWRLINLSKGCTGSWCGCYWCTKTNTAAFSYAFRNESSYQLKYVALKKDPEDTIKWGFGPEDPFWYGVNDTASISVSTSMNVELGTELNISTNISGANLVCVDIDHPDYGDNYTCGSPTANFLINISYFRKTEFNDSSTTQNLTFLDPNFNLNASNTVPAGITQNGTYLWVVDSTDGDVYYYYLNGTYVNLFDTDASGNAAPRGITHNDTYFWIVDYSDEGAYRYWMNGTYVDFFDFTNDDGANDYPYGITQNNTYFWVGDYDVNRVYRYLMNGTYIDYFALSTANGNADARGMTNNNTYIWVADADGYAYKYTMAGTYVDSQQINAISENDAPTGIIQDGIYFWVADNEDDLIYKYDFDDWSEVTAEGQYIYIKSHQYDEIFNLSLNFTGYNYSNIEIWFEGSLLESVGEVSEAIMQIDVTEDLIFARPVPDTEIFNVDVSIDANITSAVFNVTGVYEYNTLDQSSTTADSYVLAGDNLLLVQSFIPEYSNFSNVRMLLGKENYFASDTIYVRFGTTINGTEMGNATINPAGVSFLGADWESAYMTNNTVPGTTYYITIESSTANKVYWMSSELGHSPYPDGQMFWKIGAAEANFTADFAFKTYINKYPENVTLEVGDVDGIYEWNYTGEYSSVETTDDFASEMNDYLSDCTPTAGLCSVPFYISSETPGEVYITASEINYTTSPNPFSISITEIQSFLDSSSGATDIALEIKNIEAGVLGVSDLRYDYIGGNDTIEIFTFNATDGVDKTVNDSLDLIYYYSDYFKNLPYTWTENIFFLPRTNSSKNITAYGQTTTKPIINLTATNYGGKDLNLSIKINESFSCLNLTWSDSNTKPGSGNKINTTWQEIFVDLAYLDNEQIWMWADLDNCDVSDKRILKPKIYFESYCEDCIWGEQ